MQRLDGPLDEADDAQLAGPTSYRLFPSDGPPPDEFSTLTKLSISSPLHRRSSLEDLQKSPQGTRRSPSKRSRHSTSTVHDAADSPTVPHRLTFRSENTTHSISDYAHANSDSKPETASTKVANPTIARVKQRISDSKHYGNRGRNSPKPNLSINVDKPSKSCPKVARDSDDAPPPPPPKDSPRDDQMTPRQARTPAKSHRSSWSRRSVSEPSPVVLQSIGTEPIYVSHNSAASAVAKSVNAKLAKSSQTSTVPALKSKSSQPIARTPIGPKKAAAERKAAASQRNFTSPPSSQSERHNRTESEQWSPRAHSQKVIGLGIINDGSQAPSQHDQSALPGAQKRPKTAPENEPRRLQDRDGRTPPQRAPMPTKVHDLSQRSDFALDSPKSRRRTSKTSPSPLNERACSKNESNEHHKSARPASRLAARPISPQLSHPKSEQDLNQLVSPLAAEFVAKQVRTSLQDRTPISPVIVDCKSRKSSVSMSPLVQVTSVSEPADGERESAREQVSYQPKFKERTTSKSNESADDELPPPPPMKDFPPTPKSSQFANPVKSPQPAQSSSAAGRDTIRFDHSPQLQTLSGRNDKSDNPDDASPQKSKLREWAEQPTSSHGPQYICHQVFAKIPPRAQRNSFINQRISLRSATPDPSRGPPIRVMSPEPVSESPARVLSPERMMTSSTDWTSPDRKVSWRDPSKMLNWGRKTKQRPTSRPLTPEIFIRQPLEPLYEAKSTSDARPSSPIRPSPQGISAPNAGDFGDGATNKDVNSSTWMVKKAMPSRKSELAPEVVDWTPPPDCPPHIPAEFMDPPTSSGIGYNRSPTASSGESLALRSHPVWTATSSSEACPLDLSSQTKPEFEQRPLQAAQSQHHPHKSSTSALDIICELADKTTPPKTESSPALSGQSSSGPRSNSRLEDRTSSRLDSLGSREALDAAATLRARMRLFDNPRRPSTPEITAHNARETASPPRDWFRPETPPPPETLEDLTRQSDILYARYGALRSERQRLSNAIVGSLKNADPGPQYLHDLLDQHLALNSVHSSMNILFAKLKSLDYKKEEFHSKRVGLLNARVQALENRASDYMSQSIRSLRSSHSKATYDSSLKASAEESEKIRKKSLDQGKSPRINTDLASTSLDINEMLKSAVFKTPEEDPPRPGLSNALNVKSQEALSIKDVAPKPSPQLSKPNEDSQTTSQEPSTQLSTDIAFHSPAFAANKGSSPQESSPDDVSPKELTSPIATEPPNSARPKAESNAKNELLRSSSIPIEFKLKPQRKGSNSPEPFDSNTNKVDVLMGSLKDRKDSFRSETPKLSIETRPSQDSMASESSANTTAPLPVEPAPTDESEEEEKPKKIRIKSAKAASILARMGRRDLLTGRLVATEMIPPIEKEKEKEKDKPAKSTVKVKPDMQISIPLASNALPPASPAPKTPLPQPPPNQPQSKSRRNSSKSQKKVKSRRNSSDSDTSATTVVRIARSSRRITQVPAMPTAPSSGTEASGDDMPPPPPPKRTDTVKKVQPKTPGSMPRKVASLARKFEVHTDSSNTSTPTGYSFPQPPGSSVPGHVAAPPLEIQANKPWTIDTNEPVITEEPKPRTNARGTPLPRLDLSESSARSTPVDESEATTPRGEKISQARTLRVVTKGNGKAVHIVEHDDFLAYYTQSESEDM